MPSFKRIKELKSILSEFPGIHTYKELDILIEIGYHQEEGTPLTMKQLYALGIASQATVRRYLSHLIRAGMVEKGVLINDHRAVVLCLSRPTIETMHDHIGRILGRLELMSLSAPPVKKSQQTRKRA